MNDSKLSTKETFPRNQLAQPGVILGVVASLSALAVYGYLGTFSRYGSDDYCLSAFFRQDNLFGAMIQRYIEDSSRYTNILFIGMADKLLGWYNVAILPALMLALFVLGMYLFLSEILQLIGMSWSRLTILFLAILSVYLSVAQAPHLYETLYWRAGMTSHFAPVVFVPFFGAFLLNQLRKAGTRVPALWVQVACFLIPFLIGGLSEPPTALTITVLALAIAAAWWWGPVQKRRAIFFLLFWALLGALSALLLMALAPANALRMQTPPPPLPELVLRIVYYPSFFVLDTLRTLPLPTLVSVAVPSLLFYVQYTHPSREPSRETRARPEVLLIVVLFFAYLLIAATFAPSIYGQSYPAPRARFISRVIMTGAFMTEGALVGLLLSHVRIRLLSPMVLRRLAAIALALLALYPLRTVQRMSTEIPAYRQRAAAWDLREAEIAALKSQGEQDLVVRFLPEEISQDLGDRTGFRLNRCAATLYGVNSIIAVPMDEFSE
jgi:hypothetical protein